PAIATVNFILFNPKTQAQVPAMDGAVPQDLRGAGVGTGLATDYLVQPGDSVDIGGTIYRVLSVASGTSLTLSPPPLPVRSPPVTISVSSLNYRIIRQPPPMGDDTAKLPHNIVIDLAPRCIGCRVP